MGVGGGDYPADSIRIEPIFLFFVIPAKAGTQ
jgi:hypothetical protein